MRFLRTVSTTRLVAMIVGSAVAVGGGTAIAVAAGSGGPVPAAKPLAQAVHDALGAPAFQGLTARIEFTNHLIDASNIQGGDPVLTGASGRLWLSSDHRVRLELQSDKGDAQAVLNNGSFWLYLPSANTVYKGQLPQDTANSGTENSKQSGVPSVAQIQTDIANLLQSANLSGAVPGNVGGQAAYTVRITPKHDGGLLGAGELAWDAVKGVPLRAAVYAQGSSSPVLELKATQVSFGAVPASDFNVAPPPGAKVVNISVPANTTGGSGGHDKKGSEVTGAAAVQQHLPFKLDAQPTLVGLPQRSVRLLDWAGSPAALVLYGQNLGGIAVIEQSADSAKSGTANPGAPAAGSKGSNHGDHGGLSLPTISIKGVTGQELDTALGTMIQFTRGGISYTVIGSVPPAAAEAAARAL
jgi:outer membrane lipoprotein-sorting protein